MKDITYSLSKQLVVISIIIFGIITLSLGIILPNVLLPTYEEHLYQYLEQPLDFIDGNISDSVIDADVAYIYISNENEIAFSDNLNDVLNIKLDKLIPLITDDQGKFIYLGDTYYYSTNNPEGDEVKKISIANDDYINIMRSKVLLNILPLIIVTFIIVLSLLILWNRKIVKKIEMLKNKVNNLSNDDYISNYKFNDDDELKVLSDTIDLVKVHLKKQDDYKTQMYQNISHDFKTPLTVIKSYVEAIEDNMETKEKGLQVINSEINKLELKVHSLLYLNKLNYIKEIDHLVNEQTDITNIINDAVKKYKIVVPNIKWEVAIDNNCIFTGSPDMWEAVIDNLLGNFVRYAKTKIKINIKKGVITFYNDGPNIDPEILSDIFTPYKKGINGNFGLGLSIVKKTIYHCGYLINVKNEKKGVKFIIK